MEIFLAPNCASFTGSFGTKCGYAIQRHNNRFFVKRNSKGIIPPDGHWRFVVECAKLTKTNLYFADFDLPASELRDALEEANICYTPLNILARNTYHAQDVLYLNQILNCGK